MVPHACCIHLISRLLIECIAGLVESDTLSTECTDEKWLKQTLKCEIIPVFADAQLCFESSNSFVSMQRAKIVQASADFF